MAKSKDKDKGKGKGKGKTKPQEEPKKEQSLVGLRLKCSSCGEFYHETTELFDPDKDIDASMLRILPKYGPAGENWETFSHDPSIRGDCLVCPGCGAPYLSIKKNLHSGNITIDFDDLLGDEEDCGDMDDFESMVDAIANFEEIGEPDVEQ